MIEQITLFIKKKKGGGGGEREAEGLGKKWRSVQLYWNLTLNTFSSVSAAELLLDYEKKKIKSIFFNSSFPKYLLVMSISKIL